MADKEERIWLEFDIPKPKGAIETTRCTTMTRQEAIEKISHALCTQVHGPCESCEAVAGGNENHCNDYKTYAEAALNSLLEDKK